MGKIASINFVYILYLLHVSTFLSICINVTVIGLFPIRERMDTALGQDIPQYLEHKRPESICAEVTRK